MKKIIILLAFLFFSSSIIYATQVESINSKDTRDIQNKIDKIGFTILNSNGIEKRTVFDYNVSNTKNAHSRYSDRQITIYRGLYDRLNSEDEIAAVLSHEISHSIDSYDGIFRGYFSYLNYVLSPKKYEYKADKRAVDYMVNAGYNPVALIIVMNKTFSQRRYDFWSDHPLTNRRTMEIYEYIYKKYPQFLANNKYKDDLYYQNFLLTSKENRKKFQNKINSNSKKAIKYDYL